MIVRTLPISTFVFLSTLCLAQIPKQPVVGNDKDTHGCIGSAGYTFSVLRNECIRVFEQKIQLQPNNPKGAYTANAAVIFSKDKRKAEVFMPTSASGILLSRSGRKGGYVWKNGNLQLFQRKGYVLKQGSTVLFSGE